MKNKEDDTKFNFQSVRKWRISNNSLSREQTDEQWSNNVNYSPSGWLLTKDWPMTEDDIKDWRTNGLWWCHKIYLLGWVNCWAEYIRFSSKLKVSLSYETWLTWKSISTMVSQFVWVSYTPVSCPGRQYTVNKQTTTSIYITYKPLTSKHMYNLLMTIEN